MAIQIHLHISKHQPRLIKLVPGKHYGPNVPVKIYQCAIEFSPLVVSPDSEGVGGEGGGGVGGTFMPCSFVQKGEL